MTPIADDPNRPVSSTDDPPHQPTKFRDLGSVTGRVVSSSGQPVDDCLIGTTCTSEPKVAVAEIAMLSGPDGHFGRGDLRPATYVFDANSTTESGDQVMGSSPETQIHAEQAATVLIVLDI